MITLPELPYAYDALEPALSHQTLHLHHDKHHRKYVDETNKLAEAAGLDGLPLEALIVEARARKNTRLVDNAEQAWNHAFFWSCMTPQAGTAPGPLAALKDEFIGQGAAHFGSGWAWIAARGDAPSVLTTHDAADLVGSDKVPLIVCDLWEHAYYLDYRNDREGFLEKWWDSVADWDFARAQMEAARDRRRGWEFPMAA